MAQPRKTGGHPGLFWGTFLLLLGVILLLQTFNVLPWQLWRKLLLFWPVLVIIAGFSILLRHRHPWLFATITAILLIASLLFAVVLNGPPLSGHL